ncbi:hypothetical protein BaRGS_00031206 [Batillaria attramentaria]|uniref:Uncharacterized protein n=1 Tax=Batillaria attramentaria TaxID=370345 RepID=A0ABD0JRJ0_9CAEN
MASVTVVILFNVIPSKHKIPHSNVTLSLLLDVTGTEIRGLRGWDECVKVRKSFNFYKRDRSQTSTMDKTTNRTQTANNDQKRLIAYYLFLLCHFMVEMFYCVEKICFPPSRSQWKQPQTRETKHTDRTLASKSTETVECD